MRSIQRPNQYLKLRNDIWHYVRRVPKSVRHIDERVLIYRSLETDSRKVARQRRDICAAADDQRWSEVSPSRFGTPAPDAVMKDLQQRAQAFGFTYMPVSEIVDKLNGEEIVQRVTALGPINGPLSTKSSAFANELDTAFQQRRTWLIEQGYAELRQDEQKTSIIYKRGYLKALETEGFNAATEKLESMTGKAHVAAQSGRLMEGTVSQKYELPHGPHAMIETQRAFYLVPWESHHAQKWGKRIKGRVLSGGGIDWDAGRSRGIGR